MLRLPFFVTLVSLLVACSTALPLPHSPEAALQSMMGDQVPPLRFLSREGTGTTALLLYRTEAAPNHTPQQPPVTYIGSAYLEHDGHEWVVWRSSYSQRVDPATVAGQDFIFGIAEVGHTTANGSSTSIWLTNGEMMRTRTTDGLFAFGTPHGQGVCGIRTLNANEEILESRELAENRRCLPVLFWE
jgi:hypothetical protein